MQPNADKIYPRTNDSTICYLKNIITNPNIIVGDFTFYNDYVHDPKDFEKNNVLYHYPYVNHDRLIIGKFCSIACDAKFLFNSANHTLNSLSTFPFPIFAEEWDESMPVTDAWDNKGDIVIGNDVWIGYEAVIMAGVHIGDGAIIGTRAVVTKDVPPYTIVGGMPARKIRNRFGTTTIELLQQLKWWDWDPAKISENLDAIRKADIEALKKLL